MTTQQDDTASKLNDVFNYLASEDDSGELYALIREDSESCEVCYPGTDDRCWVCGGDHCELPPLPEEPKQLSLFEVETMHKCGNCKHLIKGICAIKSHDAGKDVERLSNEQACYAYSAT